MGLWWIEGSAKRSLFQLLVCEIVAILVIVVSGVFGLPPPGLDLCTHAQARNNSCTSRKDARVFVFVRFCVDFGCCRHG